MLRILCEQSAPDSFTQADLISRAITRGTVKELARLFSATKFAFGERRVNVFRSRADHRDLGIMDQHRAIGSDARHVASLHEIDDQRREAGLNYVTTDSPDDRLLQFTRAMHARNQLAQRLHRQ